MADIAIVDLLERGLAITGGLAGLGYGAYKAGVARAKNGLADRLSDFAQSLTDLKRHVDDGFRGVNTRLDKHIETHDGHGH